LRYQTCQRCTLARYTLKRSRCWTASAGDLLSGSRQESDEVIDQVTRVAAVGRTLLGRNTLEAEMLLQIGFSVSDILRARGFVRAERSASTSSDPGTSASSSAGEEPAAASGRRAEEEPLRGSGAAAARAGRGPLETARASRGRPRRGSPEAAPASARRPQAAAARQQPP
ncbi:unnamed protein product, partial [Prorocentrum cordatum]